MPATALGLALAAACVHALWNVLLAKSRDPEAATAVALIVAILAFAPVAAAVWDVRASVWPFLLGSGAFELAYFALLGAAYRLASLSVVYPLARGTAPVLVLVIPTKVEVEGSTVVADVQRTMEILGLDYDAVAFDAEVIRGKS